MPGQMGIQPPPPVAPRAPAAQRGTTRPPEKRDRALVINLSVLFAVLFIAAGTGWWMWAHRTNPKAQVTRYLNDIVLQDWGVIYDLSATPPANKSRREFLDMMLSKTDYNGVLRIVAKRRMEQYKFTVGEPAFHDDEATVRVDVSGPSIDRIKRVDFRLKNIGGIWKIYPPYDDPTEVFIPPPEPEPTVMDEPPAAAQGFGSRDESDVPDQTPPQSEGPQEDAGR